MKCATVPAGDCQRDVERPVIDVNGLARRQASRRGSSGRRRRRTRATVLRRVLRDLVRLDPADAAVAIEDRLRRGVVRCACWRRRRCRFRSPLNRRRQILPRLGHRRGEIDDVRQIRRERRTSLRAVRPLASVYVELERRRCRTTHNLIGARFEQRLRERRAGRGVGTDNVNGRGVPAGTVCGISSSG